MKQLLFILILFLFSLSVAEAQQPQPVYSIVKEDRPHSFFVEQAELWWKEVEKDRKNEKAWYNYYRANRYARMTFHSCQTPECEKAESWTDESPYLKELDAIVDQINEAIPNTYTYYILKKDGWHDEERYEALLKAYELEPDNPDTYDELVVYYEVSNNPEKRKEFNRLWFQSNDISPGILNYNYNVLMSMKKKGVLLTFGDNDTFPIWMLQDAEDIRPDITVLNIPLLGLESYREVQFEKLGIPQPAKELGKSSSYIDEMVDYLLSNIPEEIPLYTSTPAWKNFEGYEDRMYLTGLVLAYSEENLDNIALLIDNFENHYALDYIETPFSYDIGRGVVNKINVNYLPGIIKLYEHYKLSGNKEKADDMKKLGLLIASEGGDEWHRKAQNILQ